MPNKPPPDHLSNFLKRIVAVPKEEIDEQEEAYQRKRKAHDDRAYPKEIVPPVRREGGR